MDATNNTPVIAQAGPEENEQEPLDLTITQLLIPIHEPIGWKRPTGMALCGGCGEIGDPGGTLYVLDGPLHADTEGDTEEQQPAASLLAQSGSHEKPTA